MTTTHAPEDWQRPWWHASRESAHLLFFVFGQFDPAADTALPDGVHCTRHDHAALRTWEGYPLGGALGEIFAEEAPQALAAARAAPEVLRIAGEVPDPANLNYLRDTLEAITQRLAHGGVAVVDPLVATLFDARHWRNVFLDPARSKPRQHVLMLCDEDPDAPDKLWVHTRGMRKFARPDLALHAVPPAESDRAGGLCEQLVDMLALGGHFADGQALPVEGVGTLVAQLGGSFADAPFFNTHVTLHWPT